MCQPLCKLLGPELSCLAGDLKLPTSQLGKAPNATIGLLFAPDIEDTAGAQSRSKELRELRDALVKLHGELKKSSEHPTPFEVVFIPMNQASHQESPNTSTNNTKRLFSNCFPFLTISSENAMKIQEYLIRKYEIQESPSFLLVDASGEVILYDGKEKLIEDPKGVKFPWSYPPFIQLLGSTNLLRKTKADSPNFRDEMCHENEQKLSKLDTEAVAISAVKAPIKALLFAAFWCPPCKTFLTMLVELYRRLNKGETKIEIIFVSSDRSQDSFNRFFQLMPWLAIPYVDDKLRQDLTKMYNVKAIPNLTLLDDKNRIITREGRLEVNEDLEGIEFPWYPQLVEELREHHSIILNNSLCVIYFTDDTEMDYEKGETLLAPVALEIVKSDVPEACETKCFVAADSDLAESLRIFMDLDEKRTYLIIMDISNFRYAEKELSKSGSKISTPDVNEFLGQFQTNKLVYKYIQSRFV